MTPVQQQSSDAQNPWDFTMELDEIEEWFNQISSSAFNFENLEFCRTPAITPESEAILDALLPTAQSTHNLVFRVNSMKRLAFELCSLQEDYGLTASEGAQQANVS
ncbi:hypothetical protein FRC12_008599 [Ceratobasidium sp. 428]|nr:hypothetical protein FRC12_008599 [Ceratobasidium sp. 428]